MNTIKVMLLGSGELGRELVISLKRLGAHVIAVDSYQNAPAMQLADQCEVINMLDGDALETIIKKHAPDLVVPEIEAIRTEKLIELEKAGQKVIPNANAAFLTMNRIAIRELASSQCKLRTARYAYAKNIDELKKAVSEITGLPAVIKPIMSSSGKGQSTVKEMSDLEWSFNYAKENMRGDQAQVIVEEFIAFDYEITLLTIRQRKGETLFCPPIGHRQEKGDYRESWQPAQMSPQAFAKACDMARAITDELGGVGLFGVEFFVKGEEVIFSELSPRPHDTGMVTLISQNYSEFDLHARAIMGLPIPSIKMHSPAAASAVVLADRVSEKFSVTGIESALEVDGVDARWFCKPSTRINRRMGVTLAQGSTVEEAKTKAIEASKKISIRYS